MKPKELMLLSELEKNFNAVKSISFENIEKLRAIIRQAPDEALLAIVKRKIKFADTAANTELVHRGLLPDSARLDHAIKKIMEAAHADR